MLIGGVSDVIDKYFMNALNEFCLQFIVRDTQ